MAVKGCGENPPGRGSGRGSRSAPPGAPEIDEDFAELLRMLPRVMRNLRRGPADAAGRRGGASPGSAIRELFAGTGLGKRHIPVLAVLVVDGPLSVTALAGRIGLSLASTSLMVGELARVGLVERHEDELDRRRTLVSIDADHRRLLKPVVEARLAPLRRALGRMDPEVRSGFMAGWRVLSEEIAGTTDTDD